MHHPGSEEHVRHVPNDVKDTYGHNFVNEILYRNDVQNQSFDEIAKFIDRTQLQGRAVELERE
jgi:hypothetical protein